MDSKEELRKPLLPSKPLSRKIPRDYLDRPLAISEDKLDLLLQLPINWNQIYIKFALTVCLAYPLVMVTCLHVGSFISYMYQITHSEDDQYISTEIFEIPQAKYVAIGYAVLYRDMKNIRIDYENDYITLEFKTDAFIKYSCPTLGCAFMKLLFITFLPYLVAVILIGSKLLIFGLIVGGIGGACLLVSFVSPVTFACDEAKFDFLTNNNQVV